MELPKIKNIIIVILLALNMFFLVLFLIGRLESGKLERQAKDDIVSLFSQAGISVEASAIPSDSTIGYYKMTRDLESEKFIAGTLLGTRDMTATGAGMYQYSNMLGEALFYPQGDFSVTLTSGKVLKDTSDAAIIKFLNDMNIDARIDRIEQEDSSGRKTIYLSYVFNKVRIMNSKLVMVLDGNTLISLSGKRPGTSPVYADAKIMGVKTALVVYFLNQIKSLDPNCKSISFVSAGYHISDDGAGGAVLLPVWRVETNSGNYYVNGINGKISEFFD